MRKGTYKFILAALFLCASCGDNRMADSDQSSKAERQNSAKPKEDVVIEGVANPPVVIDPPVIVVAEPVVIPVPKPVPMPYPTLVFGGGGGRRVFCGNGIIERNEECDDGNKDDNDRCSHACKIINVAIPPVLSATKVIVGGTGVEADFALALVAKEDPLPPLSFPVVAQELSAGVQYTISEPAVSGYTGVIACTLNDTPIEGNPVVVTPDFGDVIECTVTNTFTPPTAILNLTKQIFSPNAPPLSDFTLTYQIGAGPINQVTADVSTNIIIPVGVEITVSETAIPAGYQLISVYCSTPHGGSYNSFTAQAGETIYCAIQNSRITSR